MNGNEMKIRKLRSAALAISAAGLAVSLAACGSSGPAGSNVSSDSATMWGLTGGNQPVLQKSVDDWNQANPDKSIKLDFFANDAYKTKVRTAVGAGEGPTFIYGWGGGVLKSYVDANQVDDLTTFIKDNPQVKDRYLPSVLKNGEVNGKTYALPNNNVQPVVLYFNKDVFDKVGAQPPKTWDELMALVPKFKEAGIAPFYQGMKKDAADFVKSGKLGYTTFPTVPGGKGDPANVVGNPSNFWSISAKATDAQKKAALDYVKDGMFTGANTDALISSGAVPVVKGIEDKLAASPDKDFLTFVYGLAKNAPSFTLSWDQALSPAQGDAMLSNLDQIFLQKISPDQFISTMNATIGK